MATTPPAASTTVQQQRELLLTRLDLEGAGATLQPTDPLVAAKQLGAVEVWAYESPDPYVSFSFYLFDSNETMTAAYQEWVEGGKAEELLPPDTTLLSGATSLIMSLTYYYTDGSHGDPDQALNVLYEVEGRVGGEE